MKRVFAFVGFSVAITLFVLNTVDYSLIKYILLSAAALLIASLLIKNLRQERVAPITFGAILFACLIFIIVMNTRVAPQKALDGQTANSEFQIIDIETKTDGGYLYTVKTSAIDLPNAPQNIKLKVKTDSKITADYYDNISGVLAFYSYTDSGFQSYGDYGDDVFVRAGLIDYEVKPNDSKPPNYYIIELRLKIKDILNKNLDEENAGLALSIFTGDKRLLYDDIDNSFKACGISHMTAVSGLHISVICLCIYYLLKFFKTPKIPQTIITLAVLLIYSGVADYSKSVLRAGIMITVMLLARLVNNKADTLNSLGFAVFIICLNPFAVTDASAVLTVTAVLGLSVVKPAYDRLFRSKNKIFRYFYDGLLIGICVLLTTLPAMWLFFGRISLMSLLLNIIGIPLLELALVSVLLLCIFSGVPFLAFVPKCLSSFSLGALIKIADFSKEHFDFLYLNISDSLFGISIAGVLLILAASLLANYKINVKAISVLLAAAFAVTTVLSIYDYNRNVYVTVSDNGGVIVYDKDSILIIDADDYGDCYTLESIVGTKKYDNAAAINSPNCKSSITDILPDAEFTSYDEEPPELCEHIGVSYYNSILTVTVYDKVFKIDNNYVTIDGYKAYRNIYERFSESGDITFIAAPNLEIQVRKG